MKRATKKAPQSDYIKIEDKLQIIPYRTVVYCEHMPAFASVDRDEYNVLLGVFMVGIATALAECVNPHSILKHGDAFLKKNYHDTVALAEKLGVIETY